LRSWWSIKMSERMSSWGKPARIEAGRYSLQFKCLQAQAVADLQVRAFAGATFLTASVVRYNASPTETLDIALPASASPALPSEYESLTGRSPGITAARSAVCRNRPTSRISLSWRIKPAGMPGRSHWSPWRTSSASANLTRRLRQASARLLLCALSLRAACQ